MICGSGGSKSRLAKAAGAEPAGQMRDEKLHAVVARSTFRSQNVQNTPFSDHFWKLRCRKSARRCGAKHISKSKCTKHTSFGPLLEVEMSKKCTPLWREAHFQVKMYKTHQLGPLLEVAMSKKCTPLWREAHFEVKMLKHTMFGPLLDVQMSKKCTRCGSEAHFQVKMCRTTFGKFEQNVRFCSISKNDGRHYMGLLKRICKDAFSVAHFQAVQNTLFTDTTCYRSLRSHFTELALHSPTLLHFWSITSVLHY